MLRLGIACVVAVMIISNQADADIYRHISAETVSPYSATVDSSGNLTENGITYPVVFKPTTPPLSWVRLPWISPSQTYVGYHSIGMELDPQNTNAFTGDTNLDKVNLTISTGHDSFASTFGNTRYLGFAVEFPSVNFYVPGSPTDSLLIAQFWQGSPYHPPVSLHITSATTDAITMEVWISNGDTDGNASASSIVVPVGTVPFNQWNTFVLAVTPDYSGTTGNVQLWVNGTQMVNWSGKVGYNPNSCPIPNLTLCGTTNYPHPNANFNVYFGPYRNRQYKKQQMFFDEVRFTSTHSEAVP